jgi:7-keto-8-aminopelargonate synthetase-like enzyme
MIILEGKVGKYIILHNERYSYFAGNNYLGLANHPDVIKAAVAALQSYGINFSASRQTTGTSDIHLELEKLLSGFKCQEESVIFASGYMGNCILLNALKDNYEIILADSYSHSSIRDAIPSGKHLIYYDHCNPESLEQLLWKNRNEPSIIITDGIFALTGEIAPLDKIYSLAGRYNSLVIVDDAHSTGVLGARGRGTPDHFNLNGAEGIYQTDTLSKALGVYGGFISTTKRIISKIRSESTYYGASTSLPPPVVAAASVSVKIVMEHPELREILFKNASIVRSGINKLGFNTNSDPTPVIPVIFEEKEKAQNISGFLYGKHIIAPFVDYPVRINKFIVRITVSSDHDEDQIENLLTNLKNWRDKNGTGYN